MDHRTSPARSIPQRKATTDPQLSCELCRKRKVKCDKLNPCTSCASTGNACVPIYRTRLPRGRHVNHPRRVSPPAPPTTGPGESERMTQPTKPANKDLQEQIYRLEALIQDMRSTRTPSVGSRDQPIQSSDTSTLTSGSMSSPILNSAAVSKRLILQRPDQFWADLMDEIHGLRDVVGSSLGEGERGTNPSSNSAKNELPGDDGIRVLGLGGSGPPAVSRSLTSLHDAAVVRQLCEIYLQQVDPVIKILHRPSLKQWMFHGDPYLAYAKGHPSVEALGSAVCYSAISSMTENQCFVMLLANKADLMAESRVFCEIAIGRAGLLSTPDIIALQAFILYLVARRSEDRTQAVWTLIAVAVRIAKGLGLYLDPDTGTFFDQQMRRRLWFTVCLMDLQASFFQASEPLISVDESASTALPQHVNDSDFDPTTTHSDLNREGLTDTTFALVTYHAQRMGRLLNFAGHDRKVDEDVPTGTSSSSSMSASHPRPRDSSRPQQQARCFEQEALRLLHFCDPGASAYAWFTWHGTQSLIATARLAALRPLQWSRQAPPPRQESNTELLRLCLPVLEKAQLMHTDPRAEGFRWYVTIPWHALAIAMAECYMSSDAPLVRDAWPLVESSYLQHEASLGQSPGGPLAQLMRRTREKLAVTARLSSDSPTRTNPLAFQGMSLPQGDSDDPNSSECVWPSTGSIMLADLGAPSLHPLSTWESISPSLGDTSLFAVPPTTPAGVDGLEPGTGMTWEELFAGIPFNEIAGADMFFFEMNPA